MADPVGALEVPPPLLGPISFIFMQFMAKNCQIISWRPSLGNPRFVHCMEHMANTLDALLKYDIFFCHRDILEKLDYFGMRTFCGAIIEPSVAVVTE